MRTGVLVGGLVLCSFVLAGNQLQRGISPTTSYAVTGRFNALDSDGDAHISKPEAMAHVRLWKHFAGADADGDGYLSRWEYSASPSD